MIMVMFVRRLLPGATFEEFKAAWMAEPNHFGQPVLVTHGQSIDDDREIVSSALLDMTREELTAPLDNEQLVHDEGERHQRIDAILECIVIRGFYEIVDETRLT